MAKRPPIRERLVFHIWDGQHLTADALHTADHKRIVVRHPGRWNVDSGPDFEDAELEINGQLVCGDVEIHSKASAWYSHQHHLDARYNNVVLHAVLWDDGYRAAIKQSGEPVPVVVMSHFLDESLEKLSRRMVKLEQSRAHKTCPRAGEICQLDPDHIGGVLDSAALQRWDLKADRLRKRFVETQSWDQVLYESLMEALGYSKNKKPFRHLAQSLPLTDIQEALRPLAGPQVVEQLRALLFGVAGLLPSQSPRAVLLDTAAIDYIAALESSWKAWAPQYGDRQMEPVAWQFFRLRPANFPTRRLAGIAQLLVEHADRGLLLPFRQVTEGESLQDEKRPWSALEGILTCPMAGYWSLHYHFGRPTVKDPGRAIGPDRARDMVVNAVLPVLWLHGTESGNGPVCETVWQLYGRYPRLAENSLTRFLARQAFPRPLGRRTLSSAMRQQGALHVYKTRCDPRHCDQCAFLC